VPIAVQTAVNPELLSPCSTSPVGGANLLAQSGGTVDFERLVEGRRHSLAYRFGLPLVQSPTQTPKNLAHHPIDAATGRAEVGNRIGQSDPAVCSTEITTRRRMSRIAISDLVKRAEGRNEIVIRVDTLGCQERPQSSQRTGTRTSVWLIGKSDFIDDSCDEIWSRRKFCHAFAPHRQIEHCPKGRTISNLVGFASSRTWPTRNTRFIYR
jgi:hypothetical protein